MCDLERWIFNIASLWFDLHENIFCGQSFGNRMPYLIRSIDRRIKLGWCINYCKNKGRSSSYCVLWIYKHFICFLAIFSRSGSMYVTITVNFLLVFLQQFGLWPNTVTWKTDGFPISLSCRFCFVLISKYWHANTLNYPGHFTSNRTPSFTSVYSCPENQGAFFAEFQNYEKESELDGSSSVAGCGSQ